MSKLAYKRQDQLYAGKYGVTPREFESIKKQSQYRSIPHAFELQVKKKPNAMAIKDRDESISFEELNKAANQVGRVIQQECPKGKETIGLLFEHGTASIIAVMAVLKSGNIYVPLDPDIPEERLVSHMSDSTAKVLVTNANNYQLARNLVGEDGKIINIEDLDDNVPDQNLDIEMSWDTPAAIYFTSGSTGKPKGILRDHGNFLARPSDLLPGDRQSHLYSYSYAPSSSNIFHSLINGVALHSYDVKKRGITQLVQWLQEEEITILHPPTSLLRQLLSSLDDDDFFPKLRRINLGGQATYKKDVEKIQRHCTPDCLVRVSFASSEVGLVAQFFIDSKTVMEDEILPAGYVVPNKEILILDEQRKQLGFNEVGEIAVRSRYNSQSYGKSAELMEEKLLPDPDGGQKRIFLTGDIGLLRPDGLLEHRGRKDFQVKIRGYRVEVSEIEAKLQAREDIQQAAVVAHEYSKNGENYLAAYMVPAQNQQPSIRSLRVGLKETLPDFMIPARFIMLDNLPQTPSGKVDRNALPAPDRKRPDISSPYITPGDKLEKQLADVWEEILDFEMVGIDDDFFELGGSSLQAMQLFVEIERMGGKKMPLSILLEASTIQRQAEILRQKGYAPDWSPVVPVRTQGSMPPLYCLAGKGGNPLRFRQLAKRLGEDRPIYFLQSRGLSGAEKPYDNVEEIAADFLAEIKKVQSSGPYFLCGSSFGGLVAFEIAQQLLSQDEEVGLLSLLDTYSPGYLRNKSEMPLLKGIVMNSLVYIRKQIDSLLFSDKASKRANVQYYREFLPKLINEYKYRIKLNFENFRYRSIPRELKEVEAANIGASRKYLPHGYPGKVVLFRATHIPLGAPPDPTLGWGDVSLGELVIHEVDSFHGNILFEPAVSKVAEIMLEYLGE